MAAPRYFHPQFASHNAHTPAAVAQLAETTQAAVPELQKLHGMGDGTPEGGPDGRSALCLRAPVGCHHDLLAYLVRRILKTGRAHL